MAPYHVDIIVSEENKDSLQPATPKVRFNPSNLPLGSTGLRLPKPPSKRPKAKAPPRPRPDDATTDFAIICDSGTVRAHKSVLVATCPYFERMFRFDGKEVTNSEVKIPGVSHRMMRAALHFMYCGRYDLLQGEIVPSADYCNHEKAGFDKDAPERARIFKLKCPCAGKKVSPVHLLAHIHIYGLADYFDMPKLKIFAKLGVYQVLHVYWKDERIKLEEALELAFSNTPDEDLGIRRLLIDTLNAHPSLWVDDGEVGDWLDEHPGVLDEVDNGRDLPPYRLTFSK